MPGKIGAARYTPVSITVVNADKIRDVVKKDHSVQRTAKLFWSREALCLFGKRYIDVNKQDIMERLLKIKERCAETKGPDEYPAHAKYLITYFSRTVWRGQPGPMIFPMWWIREAKRACEAPDIVAYRMIHTPAEAVVDLGAAVVREAAAKRKAFAAVLHPSTRGYLGQRNRVTKENKARVKLKKEKS